MLQWDITSSLSSNSLFVLHKEHHAYNIYQYNMIILYNLQQAMSKRHRSEVWIALRWMAFHTFLPMLHTFPSYYTPSLLSLVYFILWFALCALPPATSKAWASQDNAMLRQSDRKCLKSFLAGTGENQRDFKGVSQKQADAVARCYIPPLHPHTGTHIQTQTNSHTWSSCHTHTTACSPFRENMR